MEQHIRIFAATILSISIIFCWQYFFSPHDAYKRNNNTVNITSDDKKTMQYLTHAEILNERTHSKNRVQFQNEYVSGSINLIGAQIDDLELKKYKQHLDAEQSDNDDNVVLLAPQGTKEPYFIRLGWNIMGGKKRQSTTADSMSIELPDKNTVWKANTNDFSVNTPLSMSWQNSQGIIFTIVISLDDKYMLDIKTDVDFRNASVDVAEFIASNNLKLKGYASVSRTRNSLHSENTMLHEGPIGVVDNKAKEINFSDLKDEPYKITKAQRIDWLGFSDKYWLVSIIVQNDHDNIGATAKFYTTFSQQWQKLKYQLDFIFPAVSLHGENVKNHLQLFVGAKNLDVLDYYEQVYEIKMFDHAVDFGVLYFITKPIFILLNYFYKMLGNFGLAIMLLTVLTKISLFPLAYKSIQSMNSIKRLQPQINRLRDKYGSTGGEFQQALLDLYNRENVNPITGCLPLILQMPVFFALYKVLYVTIEMRHAPFYLWIHDLSVPDSTTIFNLFGLIPWTPPAFLMIGVLPIAMALSMFIQQNLNPQPADATQATVMKIMPILLLFMFSNFPSGLLLYWTWSNIISILQQVLIKKLSK